MLLSTLLLSFLVSETQQFHCADELLQSVLRTAPGNDVDGEECPLALWLDSAGVDDQSGGRRGEYFLSFPDSK